MQQILFYLGIHNIGCRITCSLIKLLLRIYTVWGIGEEGIGDWGLGIGDGEMGRQGDGEMGRQGEDNS